MIEADGLTKVYGDRAAVSGVSFRVEKGEVVGFLGPNGAGKTTTMRMLTCFLPPTAGSARVAGFDVLDQSLEVRQRIGYLPENVPLYPDLTVTSYLDFVGRLKGMPAKERKHRMNAVMEECGVTEVKGRPIGHLSRGYRQRVGLAQALINDPEVLIMDEPTVGLDPRQIIEIRELIRDLAGKRTVMLSTHILPEASLICQRVLIINNGVLVSDGVPEDLGKNLGKTSGFELTVRGGADPVRAVLEAIPGAKEVVFLDSPEAGVSRLRIESEGNTDIREAVAARIVSEGFGLIDLHARDVSLEDIFVRLVTQERSDV